MIEKLSKHYFNVNQRVKTPCKAGDYVNMEYNFNDISGSRRDTGMIESAFESPNIILLNHKVMRKQK